MIISEWDEDAQEWVKLDHEPTEPLPQTKSQTPPKPPNKDVLLLNMVFASLLLAVSAGKFVARHVPDEIKTKIKDIIIGKYEKNDFI